MSDYTYSGAGGGGCLSLLMLLAAGGLLMFLLLPGEYESNGDRSRSGVLSGNQTEVLSRNQINIASEVQNCYGDYSCTTVISSTTTSESNTSNNTDITTTAGGDLQFKDGGIVFGDGVLRCWDASAGGWVAEACQAQGVQP
jgi:hypothetical protein